MADFFASDSIPVPPTSDCDNPPTAGGDCYMYCQEVGTDNYVLFSSYEGSPPAGGLTGTIASYAPATECILSSDQRPTALPDCDLVEGGTFCLGTL